MVDASVAVARGRKGDVQLSPVSEEPSQNE